jgi:murein DD-endopeptidase MepM/ murein hydrolase activator NlpD
MTAAYAIGFVLVLSGIVVAGDGVGRSASRPTKATEVFQGEIIELKIAGAGLTSIEGRIGKETIRFYTDMDGNHRALFGADVEAKPGPAVVNITSTTETGARKETKINLRIKPKAFRRESFSVGTEFDQLSPEVLDRIKKDQEQFSRVFMSSAPERLWEGPFMAPVSSDVTSPFGYRRVINGLPRAPHSGVDLKAAMGTEVLAANRGRVVLLGDFFFSGNSVVLDHGGGLHTMYFHLSVVKVSEGSVVRKGEVIGLAGMSGRVTGPHLHWGARINDARVDPFELIKKLANKWERSPGPQTVLDHAEK